MYLRSWLSVTISALVLLAVSTPISFAQQHTTGTVTVEGGETIEFVAIGSVQNGEILPLDDNEARVRGEYQGKQLEMGLRELQRIEVLERGVRVTTPSGETFILSNVDIQAGHRVIGGNSPELDVVTRNPINNSLDDQSFQAGEIKRVTINSGYSLKKNPNTNRYFPSSYNFDPFTGAELVSVE